MAKAARFEGSAADRKEDRTNAKKRGMSLKAYERSAQDRNADAKGQKALDRKAKRKKAK